MTHVDEGATMAGVKCLPIMCWNGTVGPGWDLFTNNKVVDNFCSVGLSMISLRPLDGRQKVATWN